MDEIEIISLENVKEKIEDSSVEELIAYKAKLKNYIEGIDNEIEKRNGKKAEAEKFFKNSKIK